MLKKIFFTAFLGCLALSANAQIATPQLDAGFHTYGGAAAGWRYGSTINLVGLSAEGKVKYNDKEVGDVTTGMNAKGPEDSASPIPFLLAAYRGDSFAGELYSNIADGLKTDVEMDVSPATSNTYNEEKELRLNLAYVIGETLSIGLGYSSIKEKEKYQFKIASYQEYETVSEITTVGTSVTASFRLAEIFFIAGGMESVTETGTYSKNVAFGATTLLSNFDGDYVDNSWTNTMYGLGLITGKPGDTQFRVEYSVISSPESDKEETGKATSSRPQTNTAFASAEARFGNFLVAYLNETKKEAELNKKEKEAVTTSIGLGWQPMQGLTVSLYSLDNKVTLKKDGNETVFNPIGYRFFIGYNF